MNKQEKAKPQIKTKERVADHGEVFTNPREVNAMLDLVKSETERIDSRFLEPACGDGNFLSEILNRKLSVVKSRYSKSPSDYIRYSILALTSVYGIELLQDNVVSCRSRLYQIWKKEYDRFSDGKASSDAEKSAYFVLERNILCGNALTLKKVDDKAEDLEEPIIFSEWSFVSETDIKRRDYRLDQLLSGHDNNAQLSLFENDADSSSSDWEWDEETQAFIPTPIKEFPLIDYRKVWEQI
jgi:hypothetical protein